jgi:hypothetical protein
MLVAVIQIAPAAWATVVSGQITNSAGAGLANVDLDFIDRDTDTSIPLTNDDTDFLGFFAVNVPPGDYDVRIKPPQGARYVGVELRGESVQGASMTLNQELDSGWFLEGRVIDDLGAPATQLDLDFIDVLDGGPIFVAHDGTNALGQFQVVLPTGQFDMELEPAATSNLVPLRLDGLTVAADANLGDVVLIHGVHLSGQLKDPLAAPAPAVLVRLHDPWTGEEIFNIRNQTDVTGSFDLIVAPGLYDLWLIPPRGASWLPRFLSGVSLDANLALPPVTLDSGSLATGRVLSGGDPAEGIDLDFTMSFSGIEALTPKDNTDQNGDYSIAVFPGTYDLYFDPPPPTGLAPAELLNVDLSTSVTVPNVSLQQGRVVSGLVRDGLANPVAGVDLDFLLIASGNEAPSSGDHSDIGGSFAATVAAGVFDIEFNPPAGSGLAQVVLTGVTVNGNVSLGTVTLPAATAATPTIVSPVSGSADGGTLVTVTGSGFAPGVKVKLGGRALSGIELINDSTVRGTTRTHPAGTVDVELTNPGTAPMVLSGAYTFTTPAVEPVLTVTRTGPLNTDIRLEWTTTGQPLYTIWRSTDKRRFGDAEVLGVQSGISLRDDGAASATAPAILFYQVQ